LNGIFYDCKIFVIGNYSFQSFGLMFIGDLLIIFRGLQYLSNGKGCRKLTYLDLSGCHQITAHGFSFIAHGCTNLQSVFLNDLYALDDSMIMVSEFNVFE